ncbi:hypothetical protein PC113_g9785 [Phytophthora cactorum]|uniref:Protein kinase domain-containing protein n=1 Tax=Phytophthora cactorum TaxID=29920 RepID=A0A8T0Z7K9_9STRA|nr:hypothetical protein PC113_g9785 [Phytophthora cactorum]
MAISPKDATDKPSIDEFAQGKPLGEGNFSRILEATHKATGEKFALKVIEKQRIKRLRLRHQNIFNEINMEKDVLNRLRHPNIIRLYQTFQDDNNLYFLLDLLDGGELLSHLLYEGRQLGLEEDLARFYLADVVNAVEYMHSNQKDPSDRLGGTEANAMSAVKAHPFFKGINFDNHMQAQQPTSQFCGSELFPLVKSLAAMEKARNTQDPLNFDGDVLQEQIKALSSRDRSILMHILRRKQILHLPGLYPRFFSSVSRGRCLYARNQGYVGFTHDLQNQWSNNFSFMQLSGPKLGHAAALAEADNRGGSTWETESAAFLEAVTVLNSQQPAFVVIYGDFVNAKPSQEFYDAQVVAFQELLNQINPQVRLVFAAGSDEFGNNDELTKYQERFGDARFSFWCGGIKIIVVDTAMLCHGKDFEEEVAAQTEWMKKELENGKLCARGTVVISGHSLYPTVIDANTADTAESNNDRAALHDDIPEQLRAKYWDMIKNGQACLVMSGNSTINNVTSVVTKASEEGADEYKCEIVSCKAPWGGTSSVIHHTEVSQAGVVTKAVSVGHSSASVRPGTTEATKHSSLTPEEEGQETVLAAEMVTVSVNSARNDE